jgi:RimJ/RimL family protein N-acetyltransferase
MSYLRAFYEVMGECGLTRPPWEAWQAWASDNAELWPITDKAGVLVGGVFFKGQSVHIAVKPEWHGRWISKRLLKAYRQWTHECEIVATPEVGNKAACELAARLGFKNQGPTENGLFIKFVKEATCHPQ